MYLIDIAITAPSRASSPDERPPSAWARGANRALARAWRAGVLEEPPLTPERLVARATEAERSDDFGPDHWLTGLQALTDALAGEAALTPLGRTLAYGQISATLRQRLRAYRLWHERPDILEQPIVAPIIVLGSMRSGTTRMQRLLGADPRLSHTRLFESLNPMVGRRGPDLRRIKAALQLTALDRLNPALQAIHPATSGAPDEEFSLFGFAFNGAQFEAQWRVPGYAEWRKRVDPRPGMIEFKRLLQTIQWSRRERQPRPWVLKAPQFMEELDALLEVFPDARLVCLHREAAAVVGSSCSLVWEQQRLQSAAADRAWIGREWLAKTARRVALARQGRASRPDIPSVDLTYAAVSADWRGTMARVYDLIGLPLDHTTERRMAAYLARSSRRRKHRYRLEDFGLSEAEVAAALPGGA